MSEWCSSELPQHEEAHGDAVVEFGLDSLFVAARRAPAAAFHGQGFRVFLHRHAAACEAVGDGGPAVALLHPQLAEAVHDRAAAGDGGDRESVVTGKSVSLRVEFGGGW